MDDRILLETIRSRKRERKYVEEMELGSIIAPIIKQHNWDVYIYGCRTDTISLLNYLNYLEIRPLAIFDRDSSKHDLEIYGIKVIGIDEMSAISDVDNAFLIINISGLSGIKELEVLEIIKKAGIKHFYPIIDDERLNINAYNCSWTESGRDEFYKNHEEELLTTYNSLGDDVSRRIMVEYIRRYTEYGTFKGLHCDGRLKYFYGQYENGGIEDIYRHDKNEVWLNCGANIGDSIFSFFANKLTAKKVLAYEGNTYAYNRMIYNLSFLDERDRKKVVAINEMITGNTNVEKYLNQGENITLINADIEGCELDLVLALKERIRKDRPVLAICAYHKNSDLIDLPKAIIENAENYVVKLRKYESSARDISRSSELVLYGIPKERMPVLR